MNEKMYSGILLTLLLTSMLMLAFNIEPVRTVSVGDDYCWIDGDSLDVGFSKYGEMINPDVPVGLRYGPVDPFANENIMMIEWNRGWLMNVTYEYGGALHHVWAFALFSDFRATGGDWINNASSPLDERPGYKGGRKTNGHATTEPIEVLQDDPDRCVVLLKTTMYDPEISNPSDPADPKGLPLVDLYIHVVFDKMKKCVVLADDVKLRSESRSLGKVQVKFGRRGEWDLGWEPYSWLPRSYAHFYHTLPYDLVQIIDQSESYVAYAAYWPELMSWRVEAISQLTRRDKLTALSDWKQDDMTYEPRTPYTSGEWVFDLSYENVEFPTHEFRCITVYGVNDLSDGEDWDMGGGAENIIDSEVSLQLEEVLGVFWTVDDDRVECPHADFTSIQPAINAANPGDTVYVYKGLYYENVVVDRSVSLLAQSPTTAIIVGTGEAEPLINVMADDVELRDFAIVNSAQSGIFLEDSSGSSIRGNIIVDSAWFGIELDWSSNNCILGNSIANNAEGIRLVESSDNDISGNNIEGNGEGILLDGSSDNRVSGNNIADNGGGIVLVDSLDNNVSGNSITANDYEGIFLVYSSNNRVVENNITNNDYGVWLVDSSTNIIADNNLTANKYIGTAIESWFDSSSNNHIVGNKLANSEFGMVLDDSSNNFLQGNLLDSNLYGFWVQGHELSHYLHSIDTSNLVDGKPVYYLVNQHDLTIKPSTHPEVGFLALINSTNITVEGLNLTKNLQGLLMVRTNNTRIQNNNIANNYGEGVELFDCWNNSVAGNNITDHWTGISVSRSSNNSISGNNITANYRSGVWVYGSNNTISGNSIENNGDGICLVDSSNNTIASNYVTANNDIGILIESLDYRSSNNTIADNRVTANYMGILIYSAHYGSSDNTVVGNEITDNEIGMILAWSSNNIIYHNNFVNNTQQVDSYASTNIWDDGYPSGGNYWSDYSARYPDVVDENQGENQHISGSDGVWDHPYEIDADNIDNYPLVEPWSPLPQTIEELETKIEELGSEGEIDNQGIVTSLLAKLDVAQKLIDKGKIDEAKSILGEDFIPQVQNLSGVHIAPEAAEILIESVEHIISNL